MEYNRKESPVIGVAFGSGAARGWSHIGVLQGLAAHKIVPGIVCGSSIGALIAGAYAAARGEKLREHARTLTRRDLVRLLDVRLSAGGLVGGEKLRRLLTEILGKVAIEDLPVRFGATATDIHTGEEVWLRSGDLATVVRTSIAFPGILSPVLRDERHLVDGGLVNPVPVSLCRDMGADFVIAVNINSNRIGRRTARKERRAKARSDLVERLSAEMPEPVRAHAGRLAQQLLGERAKNVELWDVLISALNIMQEEITRSQLRQHLPNLLIEPSVHHIGLLEFHRTEEAIRCGQAAVESVLFKLAECGIRAKTTADTT